MPLPIVCSLTAAEQRERRRTILDVVRQAALEVTQIARGISYRLSPTSEVLAQVAHLVDLERQCCPFLSFKIVAEATTLSLEITGPPEAERMIADFFGANN